MSTPIRNTFFGSITQGIKFLKRIYRKNLTIPTISYMALIFYFSSFSRPIYYELPYGLDKAIHFFEYAVLGFLLSYGRSSVLVGWIFGTLYGISDEIYQLFIPMRNASIYDMMADSIGSFIGAYSYFKSQ